MGQYAPCYSTLGPYCVALAVQEKTTTTLAGLDRRGASSHSPDPAGEDLAVALVDVGEVAAVFAQDLVLARLPARQATSTRIAGHVSGAGRVVVGREGFGVGRHDELWPRTGRYAADGRLEGRKRWMCGGERGDGAGGFVLVSIWSFGSC